MTWEVGYDERGLKRGGSYSARKGQIGKMRGVGERRTLQDVALMDVPIYQAKTGERPDGSGHDGV